ncbi:unnamed protein product [Amoebophrya sp. A25]|nr:unnamed protein product [Amoebophrya sp. A25]|eukprot:GSA25T00005944001.1
MRARSHLLNHDPTRVLSLSQSPQRLHRAARVGLASRKMPVDLSISSKMAANALDLAQAAQFAVRPLKEDATNMAIRINIAAEKIAQLAKNLEKFVYTVPVPHFPASLPMLPKASAMTYATPGAATNSAAMLVDQSGTPSVDDFLKRAKNVNSFLEVGDGGSSSSTRMHSKDKEGRQNDRDLAGRMSNFLATAFYGRNRSERSGIPAAAMYIDEASSEGSSNCSGHGNCMTPFHVVRHPVYYEYLNNKTGGSGGSHLINNTMSSSISSSTLGSAQRAGSSSSFTNTTSIRTTRIRTRRTSSEASSFLKIGSGGENMANTVYEQAFLRNPSMDAFQVEDEIGD